MSGTIEISSGRSRARGSNGPANRRRISVAAWALNISPGLHPHDPNLGMVAFDAVELALNRDLVPGIEQAPNPVGRPRFVDQAILRSRRVGVD
jgi:hypothetical protein